MASKSIDIRIDGSNNAGNALRGAAADISKLNSEAGKSGQTIGQSMGKAGNSISKEIGRGSSAAQKSLDNLGKSGAKSGQTIIQSMDGVGAAIAGLAGSYGILQLAQSAWTGATQREFNQAYLATKLGADGAKAMTKQIADIVKIVPGDDTFLNQLLTGAVAKQTNLSKEQLTSLGYAVADYMSVSSAMGKSQIETQNDLNEYIKTGNTSQLERDSILKNQMGTLEGQATVSDRIKALNKALVDEGYNGLSKLEIASIKWETVLGTIQQKITDIGSALLVFISPALDLFTWLDEKTNGLSTTMLVLGGAAALLGIAFVGIAAIAVPAIVELAIALGVVAEGATFGAAAFGLLEVAMGPVGWAILAITAGVAAGIFIWQNWGDEITAWGQSTYTWLDGALGKIKSGDWAGGIGDIIAGFKNAGQQIYTALATQVVPAIQGFINNLPSMIGNLASFGLDLANNLVNWLITGLESVSGMLDGVLDGLLNDAVSGGGGAGTSAGASVGEKFGAGFMKWLDANGPKYVNYLSSVFTKLLPLLGKVGLKIGAIIMLSIYEALIPYGQQVYTAITSPFVNAYNWVVNGWNTITSTLGQWINTGINVATGALSWAWNLYNTIKAIIGGWISTGVNVATGALSWAWSLYNTVKSIIGGWINTGVSVAIGGLQTAYNIAHGLLSTLQSIAGRVWTAVTSVVQGPAGPGLPRGPSGPEGISYKYQDYGGTNGKNPWISDNCLSGNCFDMTLGLMGRYGGSMVNGTWNGGPHVWWQSPSGEQFDPARMALNGTGTPPPRGPGDSKIIIPVSIGGSKIAEFIVDTVTKEVIDAGRF